jgi:TrmH family RNA methyltransferase
MKPTKEAFVGCISGSLRQPATLSNIIPVYKKEHGESYAPGAYATFELLSARPKQAEAVYIHPSFTDAARLEKICENLSVPVRYGEAAFRRISQKENIYVTAVFHKYTGKLSPEQPHVVLVNPGDMGNLGSTLRTLAGLNLTNIAVITPAADIWHPKTVRASMGAVFRVEVETFADFSQYRENYGQHTLFPFMLNGRLRLTPKNCPIEKRYALVFGSEAAGLPPEFHRMGESVTLAQSALVDSYNITVAVGIGAYLFANANGQV